MKRFEMLSKHAKLKRSPSPPHPSSPSASIKPTSPQTNDLNYKRRSLSPIEYYTASSASTSASASLQDNIEEKFAQLTEEDEHAAWDKFREHAFSYGNIYITFNF